MIPGFGIIKGDVDGHFKNDRDQGIFPSQLR